MINKDLFREKLALKSPKQLSSYWKRLFNQEDSIAEGDNNWKERLEDCLVKQELIEEEIRVLLYNKGLISSWIIEDLELDSDTLDPVMSQELLSELDTVYNISGEISSWILKY